MTKIMIATSLCATFALLGCSRTQYVSKYPETASAGCSIPSSVFECSHREAKEPVIESQQAQVAAERGTADVEAATLANPSPYAAPPQPIAPDLDRQLPVVPTQPVAPAQSAPAQPVAPAQSAPAQPVAPAQSAPAQPAPAQSSPMQQSAPPQQPVAPVNPVY